MYLNVHSLAFLIFLFPFKLFFLLLLRSPPSKQSLSHLCPFALLQCLSQYKDHMRQQSREPKDIRERAVCVTSSLDGLINVHETHLHCYPLPQEPTHSQTPSGSSLNKLQMGEEVRVHMYMQHLDSSCTIYSSTSSVCTLLYCMYSRVVSMYVLCILTCCQSSNLVLSLSGSSAVLGCVPVSLPVLGIPWVLCQTA